MRRKIVVLVVVLSASWICISFRAVITRSLKVSSVNYQPVSNITLQQNYRVSYPVFHVPELDAVVTNYVKYRLNSFQPRGSGQKLNDRFALHYSFAHVGTRTATINFTEVKQRVNRSYSYVHKRIILDKQKKKELTAKDIIQQSEAARTKLAKLLYRYFKHQPALRLSGEELVRILEMRLEEISNVSLEADTLTIYLNPHNLNSMQDVVAIAIKKPLLEGVLVPEYLENEADVLQILPPASNHYITEPPMEKVDPADKLVALTFDDGPSQLTPRLLDILEKYDAHTTFFVLGHLAGTYQTVLRDTVQRGHEIGNHSWNHPDLRTQSPAGLDQQIGATEAAIQAVTGGFTPRLMRPPYGGTNPLVQEHLASHHLTQALWNVDTNDWRDRDSELIYQRIMAGAHDGAVILLHDIYPTSVDAARRAIRDLKARGYQLVTVSQLYQYRL